MTPKRGLSLALLIASAVTVVVLGLVQFSRRWRELLGDAAAHGHSHASAVTSATSATTSSEGLRGLLILGASSGLTPCPSALALLLSAIALHRYGFGLVLVVAFSIGVATTLAIAGLLVVMARQLLDRVRLRGVDRVLRWLPIMSSMCVLLMGILLCASAWSPR